MRHYYNARLRHQTGLFCITTENGIITDIRSQQQSEEIQNGIDVGGKLLCDPFCDPHIHLDYVFTAGEASKNETGTLFDGIASWSDSKQSLTGDDIKARAKKGLREQILGGTQFIRTHVDVTDPSLTALRAMVELREEIKDIVDLQIVAFPQEGMYAYKGGEELVEKALQLGADVVGAIPHFEHTRELGNLSVKKAVELAVRYGKLVDIHCDETDDEQSRFIEVLADEALQHNLGSRVTASHACAMGSYNNAYAFRLIQLLKKSGLNVIACPTENVHLQGRYDTYPKRRGVTRVPELTEAGVTVSFAQDSICDPWYPLGNGRLIHMVDFGLHLCHMMQVDQISKGLDFITTNGAKTLGIKDYGIAKGNPESFIIINASNDFEAIRNRAEVIYSVHRGNVIFEKQPTDLIINNLP